MTSPKSIRDAYTPEGVLSEMRLYYSTALCDKFYIIVEGEDDTTFYGGLMNNNRFIVRPATIFCVNKKGDNVPTTGCENLRKIMTLTLSLKFRDKVIAIRDKDYTTWCQQPIPSNTFLTDTHDLETFILSNENSVNRLMGHFPAFKENLEKAKLIARRFGYVRLHNELHHAGINFDNDLLNPCEYLLPNSLDTVDGWESKLVQKYNSKSPNPPREGKTAMSTTSIACPISQEEWSKYQSLLADVDDFDLCQGHDLIKILYHAKTFNGNVSKSDLKKLLFDSYDINCFKGTNLYALIFNWLGSHKTA